jgi:HlyD family secretion protein
MTTRYLIATALVCSAVGLTACGGKKEKTAPASTAAARFTYEGAREA